MIVFPVPYREKTLLRQDGRTYTIGSFASLRWVAKTVNCHAHPRILLPQNRCLPEPLAAPFPRQPEPRCNTLDFASKVVCQRGAAAPLETQEKRPSTALLVLGQCADPLAHGLDQRNDKRIHHGEIAQSFVHLRCAWHIRGTDGENRDRNNHSIDQVSCKIKKTTTKGLYSVL